MKNNQIKIIDKFKALPKTKKILVVIGASVIFGILSHISSESKPSICDCYKVNVYTDDAVDAAKRILGNLYGADFMRRSQNECSLKYWDEVKKWQESNGFYGNPGGNAIAFFTEKCK